MFTFVYSRISQPRFLKKKIINVTQFELVAIDKCVDTRRVGYGYEIV